MRNRVRLIGLLTLSLVAARESIVVINAQRDQPIYPAYDGFVKNPDGTRNGGVHDIFTIAGRSDASGCALAQPDFTTELAHDNVILRIPTPNTNRPLARS